MSREAILDFGTAAYSVGIPLLFSGVILGWEDLMFAGATLALVGITIIAAA